MTPKPVFRHDIQGLRAIAVIAVVLYHAGFQLFSGGFVGVDVFFVVSGYLITGILARELDQSGRIVLANFYARRIRRLLPAAVLVIAVTAIVSARLLSPIEQRALVPSFISTAMYFSNFWFAWSHMDYLGTDIHQNPLLHTWSLSIEEQFYLIWPALFLLVANTFRSGKLYRNLLLASLGISLMSFALSVYLTDRAQPWAFFSSPSRAWEFAIGGAAYLVGRQLIVSFRWFANCLFAVGLSAIFWSVFYFNDTTIFPGFSALVPTLGTVLVLKACEHPGIQLGHWLSYSPLQRIGDLSYSWYLWHWPVQIFYLQWTEDHSITSQLVPPLVSLLLASLTYTFVENKIRFSTTLKASPARSIALGAFMSVFAVSCGAALFVAATYAANTKQQQLVLEAKRASSAIYDDGCHLGWLEVELKDCRYGDANSETEIIMFGDSHVAHWFPALDEFAKSNGYRLTAITKSSCPAFIVSLKVTRLGRPYRECDEWRDQVLEMIEDRNPEMVFVSGNNGAWKITAEQGIDPEWANGATALFAKLAKSTNSVFVIRDIPNPGFDVPNCLSRALVRGRDLSACDFDRSMSSDIVDEYLQNIISSYKNIYWIDATDRFCTENVCRSTLGQHIAYRDNHHLSVKASMLLSKQIQASVAAHIAAP